MKVVLLQDVAKIGRRHEGVDVPTGYAQNMLIPKQMAAPATPDNLKKVSAHSQAAASQQASVEAAFTTACQSLKDTSVTVIAEANEQEHLFKAIHESDIVLAAADRGITFEGSSIKIAEPIKSLGNHVVTLVCQAKQCDFTVSVIKK